MDLPQHFFQKFQHMDNAGMFHTEMRGDIRQSIFFTEIPFKIEQI